MVNSFNPVEYHAKRALQQAENKPIRSKPSDTNADPPVPVQGPQVAISELPEDVRAAVATAEAEYQRTLEAEYEVYVLKNMTDETRTTYGDAKKAEFKKYHFTRKESRENALATAEYDYDDDKYPKFDVHAFNVSYSPTFYSNFDSYCANHDSYALSSWTRVEDGKTITHTALTQWERAIALINKSCIRMSSSVRDVLACFLDNVVMQYARNGFSECVRAKQSNLQIKHAVVANEAVSLDAFVRTLSGYQQTTKWLVDCADFKAKAKVAVSTEVVTESEESKSLPKYPVQYDENFDSYVSEICRSVRMAMAKEQTTPELVAAFTNVKVSDNFKKFCSVLVYETILRVGAHLREVVTLKDVKTVNRSLMFHSIKQLCNVCGINFDTIGENMNERLEKYRVWCAKRRDERRKSRNEKTKTDEAEKSSDEEEDDEDEVTELEYEQD